MLTLSTDATQAIEQILEDPEVPEGGGLRIAPADHGADGDGAEGTLALSVTTGPGEGDEVVTDQGARVFLDGDVAPLLDDKTLDVSVDGQALQFRLEPQA